MGRKSHTFLYECGGLAQVTLLIVERFIRLEMFPRQYLVSLPSLFINARHVMSSYKFIFIT